jgi:hypothetical protein
VRWVQQGFRRSPGVQAPEHTQRNLLGQLDGTANPRGAEIDPAVWNPDGSTTLVVRRIRAEIEYATTQLHGATACLTPIAAGMGNIAGWTAADYLYQHARKIRDTEPLSDLAWQALIDHHHPNDTMRLADNAARRHQLRFAEIFYRQAADAGDRYAATHLTDLLIKLGRIDEAIDVLRQRADAGSGYSSFRLADLLIKQGRIDELDRKP